MRVERIGEATLYLGDCREVLPTLGKVDAVVTDPPYGSGANHKGGLEARARHSTYDPAARGHVWRPIVGDDAPFDPTPLLRFQNLVLWGANNYAERLPSSACWLAWDRKMGRAADSNIGDAELAYVRGVTFKTVRMFRHMWAGFQRDSEVGERHLHPTQKPVALLRWCVEFFPAAETIVDPYMGSGTTGVAAVRLGRKFVGVEIDPDYFATACRRIEAAYAQPDLFVRAPEPKPEQLSLLGANQ
jgi:site-specific DNA-methyltransferase (adenine-specific)